MYKGRNCDGVLSKILYEGGYAMNEALEEALNKLKETFSLEKEVI